MTLKRILFVPVLLLSLGVCLASSECFAYSQAVSSALEKAALDRLDPVQEESVLLRTLSEIDEKYPDSTLAAAKVAPLLHDSRSKVRRKAIRTLGILPAKLDATRLADVAKMLSSSDKEEVADALRGLRWLYSPDTIPLVVPLLADGDEHVKREACRTLAIIADRSVITRIEPLLQDGIKDVREDAQGAIAQLKGKP